MIDEKRADKILKTIRGLEHELIADKAGKPIDYYRNRCLEGIEKIKALRDDGKSSIYDKEWYLKAAFNVYAVLQAKDDPPDGGSQDYARRELADSPALRSSRGFAKMNWSKIGWTKGGAADRLRGYYGGYVIKGMKPKYPDDLSKTDYWAVKDDKKKD